MEVYDASTLTRTDTIRAAGQAIARVSGSTVTWLHNDTLGSAATGTNASGTIAWTEHYTPYGETTLNPAANDNQPGFTGHLRDKATGLNYMQARYYDPAIGRFLSIDPVNFSPDKPFMFGRYTYVGGDPVNGVDPFGLARVCKETTGSRIKSCVNVDGDGDGNTKDKDLSNRQISALGKAFGTFIRNNNGADLSKSGANVSGSDKDATNLVRATSQFVGAAVGFPKGLSIIVAGKYGMSLAKYGSSASSYYSVGKDTAAITTGPNAIYINTQYSRQFKNPSDQARTLFHERLHATRWSIWNNNITRSDHRNLDALARSQLMNNGLGDGGCSAVGGIFGTGLLATYPGC